MKHVAGCDVGSLTSKAVIMNKGKIIGSAITRSKADPVISAETVMSEALENAGRTKEDIAYCVGTGYGRKRIPFVDKALSEIACHGKGAKWLIPSASTIIDIGGQDCKVVKIDTTGKVEKFITNDKCASGTGRFLEVMAKLLNVDISKMGDLTMKSTAPVTLASLCTVWAQADIVKYLNSGTKIEDIGAGVNSAMAKRASILVSSIGAEDDVCITGGVSKNKGVVSDIEKLIGKKIKKARKADPQLAGAIGAALFALENCKGGQK